MIFVKQRKCSLGPKYFRVPEFECFSQGQQIHSGQDVACSVHALHEKVFLKSTCVCLYLLIRAHSESIQFRSWTVFFFFCKFEQVFFLVSIPELNYEWALRTTWAYRLLPLTSWSVGMIACSETEMKGVAATGCFFFSFLLLQTLLGAASPISNWPAISRLELYDAISLLAWIWGRCNFQRPSEI